MKVSNNNSMVQMEAYIKQLRQQQAPENQPAVRPEAARSDQVNLSRQAREVQKAQEVLKQMPDVREKEVREVKAAVNNGTYKVDGERAAQGMLRESIENDMILKKIDMRI